MSEKDKAGLALLFRSVAGGIGFVWLFGFAIGYQNAIAPIVLAGLAIGCLWIAKKILEMN